MKLSIFGAGAWGTALAVALAGEHQVTLWARDAALIDTLRDTRRNPRYLPEARLPESLQLTADFAVAANTDLALVVTPIAGLRPTLQRLLAERGAALPPVLWACKGFEAGTGLLPHEVAAQVLPAGAACGALSGPSFAKDVAEGLPSAVTRAMTHPAQARQLARQLHTRLLRLYANDDLTGVEVGGAVKNVMAIAAVVGAGAISALFGWYIWLSVMDRRTSEICTSRNRKRYRFGKGPIPPAHIRCRSHIAPIVGMDDIAAESFYTWAVRQPATVQDDILGEDLADELRNGSLKEKDLPKFESRQVLTLDEFRRKINEVLSR